MGKTKIEIGRKYGMLTPIRVVSTNKYGLLLFECVCECGNIKAVGSRCLTNGTTVSCGCKRAKSNKMGKTPTYKSWMSAKERCYNKNNHNYPLYGGRGIKMCDRWKNSFMEFLKDMGERPQGMTLDRINVNGDYQPQNCKWSTPIEQANNRRNNHKVFIDGKIFTASEFSRTYNIDITYVFYGFRKGLSANGIIVRFKNKRKIKKRKTSTKDVFQIVDKLSDTERGDGGYGSTGK